MPPSVSDTKLIGSFLRNSFTINLVLSSDNPSIIITVKGFVGQSNFATYNATKFAIRGLTKCWAQDLAPVERCDLQSLETLVRGRLEQLVALAEQLADPRARRDADALRGACGNRGFRW